MVPIVGKELLIFVLWIALSAVVIGVFAGVVRSTRRPRDFDDVQGAGYRLRKGWFIVYGVLLVISFAVTLWTVPYAWAQPANFGKQAVVVHVTAHQFSFEMPSRLPADRRIKLLVTSSDVNHGLGIYSPQGVLIAQVQAMPDYTNVLYVTFTQPGTYTIRCMELCGVGHSDMFQKLQVYVTRPSAARGRA